MKKDASTFTVELASRTCWASEMANLRSEFLVRKPGGLSSVSEIHMKM